MSEKSKEELQAMDGITAQRHEIPYVENQLIVKFTSELGRADLDTLLRDSGYRVEEPLVDQLNLWLLETDSRVHASTEEALESIRQHPNVEYAQLDHYVTSRIMRDDPDDEYFSQMWNLHNTGQNGGNADADIDALEAWNITTGSDNFVVAVVDGGVQLDHLDLVNNIWRNEQECTGESGIDDDSNGYIDDCNGWDAYNNDGSIPSSAHGTHVAGTIGAEGNNDYGVVGVNWDVGIMAIAGSSSTTSIIQIAYGYALDQKILWLQSNGQQGANVVATNSSFGVDYADCNSGSFPVWNDLYDAMGTAGILSAAATINAPVDVDEQGDVPTGCSSDYLITVTNTTRYDTIASAGYGDDTIDLGAPGSSICSTVPTNSVDCGYSGTSMATPHVAGAVALLYSAGCPSITENAANEATAGGTALEIKAYILDNVDRIPVLEDITLSEGRLNVNDALGALMNNCTPCPDSTACNYDESAAGEDTLNCYYVHDDCNVCGGDGSSCADECGVPNGDNSTCADDCGFPNGDNSTCTGCTDPESCNYDQSATIDGECIYPDPAHGCECEIDHDSVSVNSLAAEDIFVTHVFEAGGMLEVMDISLNWTASGASWPADVIISVKSPDQECQYWGGYDVSLPGCTQQESFPSSWQTTTGGLYETSIELNMMDVGSWTVAVTNGWTSSGLINFELDITMHGLCPVSACGNAPGDVNNDLAVNVVDVIAVVNEILSGPTFNECQLEAADVNADEALNVTDIIGIVNLILEDSKAADHDGVDL